VETTSKRLGARVLAGVMGLAVAFTAVVGFAHTRAGRPLLARMASGKAKGGACPFGYDAAQTPEQKEAKRRAFAAAHAGEGLAASRPALGFELGRSTRGEVSAWTRAHGVACKVPRSGPDLDCADVPDGALPVPWRGAPVASMWIGFGPGDTLASVVVVRRAPGAEAISATFAAVTSAVAAQAGPARATEGDPSAARLSAGLLQQASAEYRVRDYYAVVRATNMGDGFALTEDYRSLAD
jgi:hypothetical protein